MGKLTAEQKVCEYNRGQAAKSLSSRAALPAGWRAYARRQRFQR